MALFKIERGTAADLLANRPTIKDGNAYFTPDDGKFYIDVGNTGDEAIVGTSLEENAEANRILINAAGAEEVAVTFNADDPIPDAETYKIWINQTGSQVLSSYNVLHDETNVGDELHLLNDQIDAIVVTSHGVGELQDFTIETKTLKNGGAGWNQVNFSRVFEVGPPTVTANVIGEYFIFIQNITDKGFQYEIKDLAGNNVEDTSVKFNYQAIEYGGEY